MGMEMKTSARATWWSWSAAPSGRPGPIDSGEGLAVCGPATEKRVSGRPTPVPAACRCPRRGSAVLQTIIVMQVLLIVCFGTMEFAQFFYIRHAFQAAARDACRQAGLQSATQSGVVATAAATLTQANVTLNPSWLTVYDVSVANGTTTQVSDCTTIPSGDRVEISIATTYDQVPNAFRPLYQIFGHGIGAGKPLAGTSTVYRE